MRPGPTDTWAPSEASYDPLTANPNTVVVQETGQGRFTQRIAAGRHGLRADEPEAVGGNNTGPTPYDLLLAGLGACTAKC